MPPSASRSTGAAPDDTSSGRPDRTAAPVDGLSYEQARDELVAVVGRLEAGGETLEGSLELWERGEALAARCQQWLDGARERLDAAHRAPAGRPDSTSGAQRPAAASGQDQPEAPDDDEDAR